MIGKKEPEEREGGRERGEVERGREGGREGPAVEGWKRADEETATGE